jgi:succinyl-diaminopimelate desuccinylase
MGKLYMKNEGLDELLELYHEEMCEELQRLLKMKTVTSAPVPGAPFGEAIGGALSYLGELAEKKGFECIDFEGYASEISFGEGEESVGVVSHIDVVPEGEGWSFDPFGGEIEGGRIYGRGAVDDKGPLIAAFYACMALKESGIPLSKKVKHIIGTDEETGRFDCIRYYKEHGKVPACGIVPDSWFPAVFAEKGFVNYRFTREFAGKDTGDINLMSVKGGVAYNIVPSEAFAEFQTTGTGRKEIKKAFRAFLEEDENAKGSVTFDNGNLRVALKGEAAHASVPEEGINAVSALLRFLEKLTFCPADLCFSIHKMAQMVAYDSNGQGLDIAYSDHTGILTNNAGMIAIDPHRMDIKMNMRIPVTMNVDDLYFRLTSAAAQAAMKFDLVGYNPHFYIESDDPDLQMLVNLYRDVTGERESEPKAHGGGSYARVLEGFIPFGPSFQKEPLIFHKQDENITKERLLLLSRIYARALYELAK